MPIDSSEKQGFIRIELTYEDLHNDLVDRDWNGWEIHQWRTVDEPTLAESLIWELVDYPKPSDHAPIEMDLNAAEEAMRKLIYAMQSEIALSEKKKEDLQKTGSSAEFVGEFRLG